MAPKITARQAKRLEMRPVPADILRVAGRLVARGDRPRFTAIRLGIGEPDFSQTPADSDGINGIVASTVREVGMRLPDKLDVWLVEDDEEFLEMLRRSFAGQGWSVLPFSSDAAVRAHLVHEVPGCIVTDLRIGSDDGLALIHHIRDSSWPAPAILMSGYLNTPLAVEAMRGGVTMVVEKPFRMDQMCREVAAALASAEASVQQLRLQLAARRSLEQLPEGHLAVLRELVECRPHKQIANRLDIALRTVEKRKKELFERLHVPTFTDMLGLLQRAEAAGFSLQGDLRPGGLGTNTA